MRILQILFRFTVAVILFSSNCIIAQSNEQWHSINLTLSRSGQANCIHQVVQDRTGFLWLATNAGVFRYDGNKFTALDEDLSEPIQEFDYYVTALFVDKENDIWIGTRNGSVFLYQKNTHICKRVQISNDSLSIIRNGGGIFSLRRFNNFIPESITQIVADCKGYLWIATAGLGLFCISPREGENDFHFFSGAEELDIPGNNIIAVVPLANRGVCAAIYPNILIQLEWQAKKGTRQGKIVKSLLRLPEKSTITSLISDSLAVFWGTNTGELFCIKSDSSFTQSTITSVKLKSTNEIIAISKTNSDGLLISTRGTGIYDVKAGRAIPLDQEYIEKDIVSLMCDRTGVLWAASGFGYGLYKCDQIIKTRLVAISRKNYKKQRASYSFTSIIRDDHGFLWLGNRNGGLLRGKINGSLFEEDINGIRIPISLQENGIIHIARSGNRIWFVNTQNEIWSFDTHTNVFTNSTQELRILGFPINAAVTTMCCVSDSLIYIGTGDDGIYLLVKNSVNKQLKHYRHNYQQSESIPEDAINLLYTDSRGRIWVACKNGDVAVYAHDINGFRTITQDVKKTEILNFYDDGKQLWLTKQDFGLCTIDESFTLHLFESKNSLYRNILNLTRISATEAAMVTDNEIWDFHILTGKSSLLFKSDEVNKLIFSSESGVLDDKGVVIPANNSLIQILPDGVNTTKVNITPVIIQCIANGQKLNLENLQIILPTGTNDFAVELAFTDFRYPGGYRLSYFMEGYETGWNYPSWETRTISYKNLPTGTYILKIRGCSVDGDWSDMVIEIPVRIMAPLWQRAWFIFLCGFCLLGFGIFLYYYKRKRKTEIERVRAKLSADLHDIIGSGLTEISLLSEVIKMSGNLASENVVRIRTISERARELVSEMSDIVWLVNPRPVTLKELFLRLQSVYQPLCAAVNISFRLDIDFPDNSTNLSFSKRQHIYLIVKESVNNAVKHSGAGNISVSVSCYGDEWNIAIIDDGKGFDAAAVTTGNGLKSIVGRVKDLGGTINYSQRNGKGTAIMLSLKDVSK
ncbi:MAG: ATP-binding protein [Ignavibacteria bacterium]|nr:ATP-binding protein [Ignavibacteria bacterium]